jgi:adenylate cyclase
VWREAGVSFGFRRLDRVAVKGKQQGVLVYELLGRADTRNAVVENYERALDLYFARDFGAAIAILETQQADAPSVTLMARCLALLVDPPPADWDGVYVSKAK